MEKVHMVKTKRGVRYYKIDPKTGRWIFVKAPKKK